MDLFFDLLRSVIYGVIEGITEWLPISSTGHMILAEQVLKFSFSAEFMEMFRVVIQLGAILAVVVMYFKKLWPFCVDNGRDSGLAKHVRWPVMRLWFKIIVACLPAAVLGLALDDWIDAHFYNSVVVAVMLIVYGIAFILIERRPRVPTTTKLSRITYRQALIVGAWQVLALIPGTSRSGSSTSTVRANAPEKRMFWISTYRSTRRSSCRRGTSSSAEMLLRRMSARSAEMVAISGA